MTTYSTLIEIRAAYPMMGLSNLLVLVHLDQRGPITDYATAARELRFPSATVCRALDYLLNTKLITVEPQEFCRKKRVVRITNKGSELVREMR